MLYKPIYTLQELQSDLSDASIVAFDFETALDEKYRNEDKATLNDRKSTYWIDLINNFNYDIVTFDVDAFGWIPLTTGRPKADVMAQIHELILSL